MAEAVSVDDHLGRILDHVRPLPSYAHSILDAIGRPTASKVVARRALPAFDNSSMDGYAVRADDVAAASAGTPVTLPVVADIHAGDGAARMLKPGTAMRIMTGAPVPSGADAVVPVEATDAGAVKVQITAPARVGAFIRRAGEDVQPGETVLPAGTVLGPRHVGLLAGLGIDRIDIVPRPRVVVMSTGAELVEPGRQLGPGAIHDSNSFLLTAAARATGAIAYRVPVDDDDPQRFLDALDGQLGRADLVVTTGGVSKGTRDVVKEALRTKPDMWFGEVAMQPGKPQGFGLIGEDRIPLFALPGNPVSSYVSFEVFVAPALRRLVGRTPELRPLFRAELGEDVRSLPGKRQFLRGDVTLGPGGAKVVPVGGPGSHLLGGLGAANALIVLDESVASVEAGTSVPVMLLDRDY